MNPESRRLVQLTTEDLEQTLELYNQLMGKHPSLRRDFIIKNKLKSIENDYLLFDDFDEEE